MRIDHVGNPALSMFEHQNLLTIHAFRHLFVLLSFVPPHPCLGPSRSSPRRFSPVLALRTSKLFSEMPPGWMEEDPCRYGVAKLRTGPLSLLARIGTSLGGGPWRLTPSAPTLSSSSISLTQLRRLDKCRCERVSCVHFVSDIAEKWCIVGVFSETRATYLVIRRDICESLAKTCFNRGSVLAK